MSLVEEALAAGRAGLLKGKTAAAWKIVENIDANVIVYNPGSPLAQALLRREERQATGHVFVPCGGHDPGKEGLSLPEWVWRLRPIIHSHPPASILACAELSVA